MNARAHKFCKYHCLKKKHNVNIASYGIIYISDNHR